jgi:hypothetical protein
MVDIESTVRNQTPSSMYPPCASMIEHMHSPTRRWKRDDRDRYCRDFDLGFFRIPAAHLPAPDHLCLIGGIPKRNQGFRGLQDIGVAPRVLAGEAEIEGARIDATTSPLVQ